jgi:flagellin-like hook-associated protein FlgL
MASIIPLPTTRVSGMLVRQRLLAQLQGDQLDLFRLQNQVSTGQRFTLPSEDAPAARRAMTLQRLLERKTQLRSNIETGQSFLQSTDVALNNVAGLLGDIRGVALGVSGTTSTDTERQAAITEINRAIEQLVAVGNTQFRGRYLFAGSQTNVEPYSYNGAYVAYHGDSDEIRSYSDLGVLFSTNATGQEVFGGISSEVLGGIDLNPEVTADTPLSTLRGGRGISANGALQISDGTNSVIVDISHASTVGDVARLIEANAPTGRQVSATITGQGLTLQLDSAGGGNLTVKEVASGKAASELGILNAVGVLTNPLVGGDLNPRVTKTTQLDNLLGSKARTRLVSAGDNNDLLIQAAANGAQYNGATIQIVDDELLRASPGVAPGSEYAQYSTTARTAQASLRFSGGGNDLTITANPAGSAYNNVDVVVVGATGLGNAANASYNSTTKQLTITVDDAGATSLDEVVNAVNATGDFTATSDESAEGPASYNGASLISASDISNVQGDTGNSGGEANTLYVYVRANASTANNVAAAINAEGTFTATLDSLDTTNSSQAGTQPVTLTATATMSGGSGAPFDASSGLRIVSGQTTFTVNFAGAESVEDLLNILNGSEAGLHAEINADGTGINVRSRLSGADLQIGENGGQTATQLGIRSLTGATRLDALNRGVGVPAKRDSYQENPPAVVTDFTITASDGVGTVDLAIDVSSAETVQDVIDLINNHTLNNAAGVAVTARLNVTGNGMELVDDAGQPLTITSAEGSQAAEYLGLLPTDTTTVTSASGVITGTDRNYLETPSVFTTLIRLKDALAANDITAIEKAIANIDVDLDRVTFSRSEVGARQQALDVTEQNLEDEDVQLRSALSEELEVDLVEAISNLTARQVSLEASLKATASILQMSLLSYL